MKNSFQSRRSTLIPYLWNSSTSAHRTAAPMPIRTAASVNGGMSCATTRVAATAPPKRLNALIAVTFGHTLWDHRES